MQSSMSYIVYYLTLLPGLPVPRFHLLAMHGVGLGCSGIKQGKKMAYEIIFHGPLQTANIYYNII